MGVYDYLRVFCKKTECDGLVEFQCGTDTQSWYSDPQEVNEEMADALSDEIAYCETCGARYRFSLETRPIGRVDLED